MYSNLSLRCVPCVYRVQYLSLRCVDQEEVTSRVRNLSEFVSEEAMPAPDYFKRKSQFGSVCLDFYS